MIWSKMFYLYTYHKKCSYILKSTTRFSMKWLLFLKRIIRNSGKVMEKSLKFTSQKHGHAACGLLWLFYHLYRNHVKVVHFILVVTEWGMYLFCVTGMSFRNWPRIRFSMWWWLPALIRSLKLWEKNSTTAS